MGPFIFQMKYIDMLSWVVFLKIRLSWKIPVMKIWFSLKLDQDAQGML